MFLSIRFSQNRFFTYTLPNIKKTGKQALFRLFFPVQQALHSLRRTNRSDKPLPSALFIGMPIGIGIATAALLPIPLSLIGLIWAASPLLTALSADAPPPKPLTAAEKDRLLDWGRRSWTFFETQVSEDHPLPPAHCVEFPYLRTAAYTTPEAFAFYLIACLSACDLGWIDPFTLERRISLTLNAWKKLPTKNGLPYARYSIETSDSCKQSPIDTTACGIFALCMAALATGLAEYAPQNPALNSLSRQTAALWQAMDFGLLYDHSQQTLCKRLLPDGTLWGQIDFLMSTGQTAVFAALAAGQIDRNAWKRLRRPALHLGLQSEWGGLEEYFLASLFLPSADTGLIGQAKKYAWRRQRLKGLDDRVSEHMGEHIFVCASAHTFTPDGGLSEEEIPSGLPDLAVHCAVPPTKLAAPHAAFLALSMLPASAFDQLRQFEKAGALGQYGFYEALDYSANRTGLIVRMWKSAHIGQALAATVNYLKGNAFPQRLMRIPAFGALASLLTESADCSESTLPVQTVPSSVPLSASVSTAALNDSTSSVYLLGDSEWGVLWAKGERILPFYQGQNMAYPSSPHYLYEDGHFTGLLLFQKDQCLSTPVRLCKRENGKLTLAFQEAGQSALAALSFPEKGVLSLELSCNSSPSEITGLFCYTPPALNGIPFRLETLPSRHLLMISSADWTAALAADQLEDLFIRAEESPQPLGKCYMSKLLCRKGSFTEGCLLMPTCQIGGILPTGSTARILLAFGKTQEEVLQRIDRARAFYPDRVPSAPSNPSLYSQLPLPDGNGSSASYALTMQLQFLFENLKLRPVTVSSLNEKRNEQGIPKDDYAHLHRCLKGALHLLQKRQFKTDDHPIILLEKRNTATDELLKNCLLPPKRAELTAPPMPERTRIRLNEEKLTVEKGQDLPPVCRIYANRLCAFFADSYTPAFRFYGADSPTPIILTLPFPQLSVRQQISDGEFPNTAEAPVSPVLSLFAAASRVTYSSDSVCYTGEGYTVNVHLLPKWHALLLDITSDRPASIRLNRPAPDKSADGTDFWHQRGSFVDFCSKMTGENQTVFLLGSFRPAADRTYYLLREELNARMLRRISLFETVSLFSADKLTWQSPPPYPTPLIIHPAFSSDSPAAFPLRLFYTPELAFSDLIRLFSENDRTAQIAACLLWTKTTGRADLLRQKLPRSIGRESIYLCAARALEALYAERMAFVQSEENSPMSDMPPFPLLPYLSDAFAELAHEMGDHAGEALYRSWQFPADPFVQTESKEQDSASVPHSEMPSSDFKVADRTDKLEHIACQLLAGDCGGTAAWMDQIHSLPLFPAPEEAAALWALFWYGVIGYSETPEGFSLRPLLCHTFEGCTFTLRQNETLYRINLKRGAKTSCLLDGVPSENRFLFDKKAHFLEITVENFERKV